MCSMVSKKLSLWLKKIVCVTANITRKSHCLKTLRLIRSNRREMFCKRGVLKKFAKYTGKHQCQSLFFKNKTLAQVFFCEFCKILNNTFFIEHLRWLLLDFDYNLVHNTCEYLSTLRKRSCVYQNFHFDIQNN